VSPDADRNPQTRLQAGSADRYLVENVLGKLFQAYRLPDLAARARNLDGYPAAD
jgi:hypothetical protein